MSIQTAWGGRFQSAGAKWVDEFGASIDFDQLMAHEDIEGSLAHVQMLGHTGILTSPED